MLDRMTARPDDSGEARKPTKRRRGGGNAKRRRDEPSRFDRRRSLSGRRADDYEDPVEDFDDEDIDPDLLDDFEEGDDLEEFDDDFEYGDEDEDR